MIKKSPFIISGIIITAFVMGMFGGVVEGQTVYPEQQAAIQAAEGAAAPHGQWAKVIEEVTYYLHSDTPNPAGPAPGTYIPRSTVTGGYLDYEPPQYEVGNDVGGEVRGPASYTTDPQNKAVELDQLNLVTFTMPEELLPTQNFHLYSMDIDIYAQCVADDEDEGLQVEVHVQKLVNGQWQRHDHDTDSSGIQPWFATELVAESTGTFDRVTRWGTDGSPRTFGNPLLENGDLFGANRNHYRLDFDIYPDELFQDCVMLYDTATYPSSVTLQMDTGRVSTWIESTTSRQPIQGLPSASSTGQSKRVFNQEVIHASLLPMHNSFQNRLAAPVDYQDELFSLGNDRMYFRIRDESTSTVRYDDRTSTSNSEFERLARTVTPLGVADGVQSVNRITYEYRYFTDVPDDRYRIEGYAANGALGNFVTSPSFLVGLKGFTFEPVGDLVHRVNTAQPTIFKFKVTNFGAERDTITVAADAPGGNWVAEVINGRQTLDPLGGEGEVLVKVTPPSSAGSGATRNVVVRASSSFPNEVPAQSLTATVNVVAGGMAGATLEAVREDIEIFPGDTISVPGFRLRNTAPFQDTYLVTPVLPGNLERWTARMSPPSRTVFADSSEDFTLHLSAPLDARNGDTVTLSLQAKRVGSTTIAATLPVPVKVVVVPDVLVNVTGPLTRTLRDDGSGCVAPAVDTAGQPVRVRYSGVCFRSATDTDDDNAGSFHLEITNPSPVEDTFRIVLDWVSGSDVTSGSCADGSGRPDFWRYSFTDPRGTPETPSTANSGMTEDVVVPGHGSVMRVLHMGPTGAAGTCTNQAAHGTMRVITRSLTDRSQVETRDLRVDRVSVDAQDDFIGTNNYAGAQRGVDIIPYRSLATSELEPLSKQAIKRTTGYDEVRYRFRVVNEANERDTLVVSIPQNTGRAGWTHELDFIEYANADQRNLSHPPSVACTNSAGTEKYHRFTCPLGSWDEAVFDLVVQAAASVQLRDDVLKSTVTVRSTDDASKLEDLVFSTEPVGQFQFTASALKTIRKGAPATDVALPFIIENTGSNGDTFVLAPTEGDPGWKPRLSSSQNIFVPGGHKFNGFLLVSIPAGTTPGTEKSFRVYIEGEGAESFVNLDFKVLVASTGGLAARGDPTNAFLLPSRGAANPVGVVATTATDPNVPVQFAVDTGALPPGWQVDATTKSGAFVADPAGGFRATATFQVTPPANALGTSRTPLLVTATTQEADEAQRKVAQADLVLALRSEVGVKITPLTDLNQPIEVGGEIIYEISVANEGLGADTFDLTHTAVPGDWRVVLDPPELVLGPLEAQKVEVILSAPTGAGAAEDVSFTVFATSRTDQTVFADIQFGTVVGFNKLQAKAVQSTKSVGPSETARFVATVLNNGTLPDQVRVTAEVTSAELRPFTQVRIGTSTFGLEVNRTRDITLSVIPSKDIVGGAVIPVNVSFVSLSNAHPDPVVSNLTLRVMVFEYVTKDVDGDKIQEYAINRNGLASDGFESFAEVGPIAGLTSRVVDYAGFMSNATRQTFMVGVTLPDGNTTRVFDFLFDGDKDGRVDFLLDDSNDGLPNIYWDPDRNFSMRLTVIKDVDGDGIVDYFIDTNGDGKLDKVYNLVTGRFVKLLLVDIDDCGPADYVVDANGNDKRDQSETVLYSCGGTLVTIQKVDVDGDGKLDDVLDTDGDGLPDTWIRNGETKGRSLTLKDVNGDGILDWLYDSNGDGKDDSYYDPQAKQGGNIIDSQGEFLRSAAKYWYVPAIFGLVLVLFIVLLAVTRR